MSQQNKNLRPATMRRVLRLIAPYRALVLLSLLLAAATVVTTLYAPIVTGQGVDLIIGPGQVDFAGLGRLAVKLALLVAATAVCQWLMNVINNRITFQVVRDIRVHAFSHMEQLPLRYIDAHRPGETISRLTTDVEQFSDGLLMGFTQLFTGVLTIAVTLGFMLSIDWRITLVVVVLTPLSIFVAKFIAQHTYSMFRVQSDTRAEMTGLVEELVGEIWDEYDDFEEELVKKDDNTYEVSGDYNIYDLMEELDEDNRSFESDYNTVSGWVLEQLEHIPKVGESVVYEDRMRVTVIAMEDQRITKLRVELLPKAIPAENE